MIAGKSSIRRSERERIKDLLITRRLSLKWGWEFPTTKQIKHRRKLDRARLKKLALENNPH